MNVWNAETFANREALDWLTDLVEERDVYFIHNTLQIIVDYPDGDKPDSWDCCCAIAAVEMLAACAGKPPTRFPADAREWIEAYGLAPDGEALALADKALQRVAQESCLRDEWQESGEIDRFDAAVSELKNRLGI